MGNEDLLSTTWGISWRWSRNLAGRSREEFISSITSYHRHSTHLSIIEIVSFPLPEKKKPWLARTRKTEKLNICTMYFLYPPPPPHSFPTPSSPQAITPSRMLEVGTTNHLYPIQTLFSWQRICLVLPSIPLLPSSTQNYKFHFMAASQAFYQQNWKRNVKRVGWFVETSLSLILYLV